MNHGVAWSHFGQLVQSADLNIEAYVKRLCHGQCCTACSWCLLRLMTLENDEFTRKIGHMWPLFLASTVSALHRNAHIWNDSHPLLVNYYCWVTVYSPSMEGKKKSQTGVRPRESNQGRRITQRMDQPTTLLQQSYPMDRTEFVNHDNLFNFKSQLLLRTQKFS